MIRILKLVPTGRLPTKDTSVSHLSQSACRLCLASCPPARLCLAVRLSARLTDWPPTYQRHICVTSVTVRLPPVSGRLSAYLPTIAIEPNDR